MLEKRFNHLEKPLISQYEDYLPTAFSSELTLLQKVNKIIQDLIDTNKLTNEMVDYLNKFLDEVYEVLMQQNKDITALRLELMQKIVDLHEWLENEGIENHLLKLLEEMEETGRFEELILKATQVFGDVGTFRQWDKLIIDKVKNEFIERGGVNVKEFGVKADGVTDDSDALQNALDAGVDLVFPSGVILINKGVWLKTGNVSLMFNNTTIQAGSQMPYIFKLGAVNAPNHINNNSISGKLTLDGRMLAEHGFEVTNANLNYCDGLNVRSCTKRQIYIYRSPDSGTGWASICSAQITNCNLNMGTPFDWQTSTDVDCIGIEVDTDDCYFYNIAMVHQTTAIVNKGGNTFDRIHAWVINDYQMKKGVFFDLYSGSPISRAFSDTYYISYNINNKINLKLSDVRNFFNQTYYSLDKVVKKDLKKPVMFNLVNSDSRLSHISATNSSFAGLIDGGGNLFNVDEYVENVDFVNTTFSNLKQDSLSVYQKDFMKENWETGVLKSDTGSVFKPKTNQIASVTLKPFTIVAEEMNGEFSPSKTVWYKKNSNATLEYYNGALKVTGTGSINFGGAYLNIDYETHLFIRFRFKCEKECRMKIVDRQTGKSIVNDFTIYQKDGWHDEYFIFKVNQPLDHYDVEFQFDVKNVGNEVNTIEITELTLFDIFKRNIGYMFETEQNLADRLSEIGFVLKQRTLPLPTNQDFVIKSFPKNYGCKIIAKETNNVAEYTAFRSLEGLEVIGKEGTSNYKTFKRTIGLDKNARLRGTLFHFIKTNVVNSSTTQSFPQNNVFSDDILIDGVWKTIHFWYKDKIKSVNVSRTNTQITISKLLSSNENVSNNRCTIVEEFLTPVSNAKTFTTPFMRSTSGYHKIPIFKDGNLVVQSGGAGFADIEILWCE